jgi:hypothetical protein
LSFIGRTVTRYQFSVVLNQALRGMGIDSSKIKTQSFQIGAASCHFGRGTPHEGIKRVSRWKSDVFKTYIRKV